MISADGYEMKWPVLPLRANCVKLPGLFNFNFSIVMSFRNLTSQAAFLSFLLLACFPANSMAEVDEQSSEAIQEASTEEAGVSEKSPESIVEDAIEQIAAQREIIQESKKAYRESEGGAREAASIRLQNAEEVIQKQLDEIVEIFNEAKENGEDITSVQPEIEKILEEDLTALNDEITRAITRLGEIFKEREQEEDKKERMLILQRTKDIIKYVDQLFQSLLANAERKQAVGMDTQEDLAKLDELLVAWADGLTTSIQLIAKNKDAAEAAYNKAPEDSKAELQGDLDEAKERLVISTTSLQETIQIMKKRDLDTSQYSKLLISSTGKITQDIFEKGVAISLFSEWLDKAEVWIKENGASLLFQLVVLILILIAFRFLAVLVSRLISRAFDRSKLQISHLFKEFAISMSRKLVMLLGILVVLSQIGIDVGPMLAGLGVAGFVIGFALQNTLSNFASGMMILIYRPFDVGDAVEVDGVVGKVKAMTLVSTTVLTFDNQQLIIPNNNIWGNTIKNITARKVRRVDMTFGIGYGDDIARAEAILWKLVKEHPLVLEDPEPVIKVSALGASSVDFIVRPWSNTVDYWDVYWDITRGVKEEFDKAGVSIPFPQSDVHLYQHDATQEEKA
ncbi:MAG: mechanosensitive ion channel [Gammaproteobacteria bacterium]|jgi:small conductance mechanosensitive channel